MLEEEVGVQFWHLTSENKYRNCTGLVKPIPKQRVFPFLPSGVCSRLTYVASCVCFSASPPDRQQQPDRRGRTAEARVCLRACVHV